MCCPHHPRVLSAFKEGLFAALPHWSLKSEAKSDKGNQALGIKRLFYKSILIASQPGPFFHFQICLQNQKKIGGR
jgi:hypothetical protein